MVEIEGEIFPYPFQIIMGSLTKHLEISFLGSESGQGV